MGLQSEKIEHLQKDNLVAIEMTEVMPDKDIKMTSEEGADGIEIVKEPDITINDNDQDKNVIDIFEKNFTAIGMCDYFIQTNAPSNFEPFLKALISLCKFNIIYDIPPNFNLIIAHRLIQLLNLIESEDSENNSTDGSSIGDETGENT